MRTIHIILLSLLSGSLYSQEFPEKEIKTEVSEVTVFLDGAQVIRKTTVDLPEGETILRFADLSPFIDAKSIQVKAEGELTVLAVNHQQNYLDKLVKPEALTNLEKQLEAVEEKISLENTYLSIIREELVFLQENRDIGGRNEPVNIANLQQASDFYGTRLTSLKMEEIERNRTLKDLIEQRRDLQNQIQTLSGKKEYPAGEILVKTDAEKQDGYSLELSYIVDNAGWFPSYDIRAKNINEPVGYHSQTLPITGATMNVALDESVMALEEVVVVSQGSSMKRDLAMQNRETAALADESELKIRGTGSLAIPMEQIENQTIVNFEIQTPYTVKSNNKNYTVEMVFYELPAFYQYYSVPKIDKDAFLIAHILDWEKYNLLEGEANVFVRREKIADFTSRQFIGNKKEETRAWRTEVKNNKNQEIDMIILDQVPV